MNPIGIVGPIIRSVWIFSRSPISLSLSFHQINFSPSSPFFPSSFSYFFSILEQTIFIPIFCLTDPICPLFILLSLSLLYLSISLCCFSSFSLHSLSFSSRSFVFDPSGRLIYYWSMIVSLAFIYNSWVILYRFAFEEINTQTMSLWLTLDGISDFIYVIDIAVHFRIGYLEEGVLQTDGSE